MPLFDFQCPVDGFRFEVLFKRTPKRMVNARKCPQCGARSPVVWPKTVMRPDTYWAGHVTSNYGYVTSATRLNQEMKRRNHVVIGDRTDREGMDKVADRAMEAKDAKLKKDTRKWAEKTFGPSGLGLGGADGEKFIKENAKQSG